MLNRTLLFLTLAPLACAGVDLPAERPFICGRLTTRTAVGLLVEATPLPSGARWEAPAADIGLGPATELRRRDGSVAPAQELARGRIVSVWITGDIQTVAPPVVSARLVVIEAPAASDAAVCAPAG